MKQPFGVGERYSIELSIRHKALSNGLVSLLRKLRIAGPAPANSIFQPTPTSGPRER
ncbi:MAG: hypothetical protein BWZ10_01335 [candidate division BRC1 bacterium ADurb.BinA364]|nr:MAG: hypothetical protein BWZ10_01335 [candidate division BRC1 bacterium ADurb.BinA364]